jgi:eukaryotic-like serine/threonine-protein kinase
MNNIVLIDMKSKVRYPVAAGKTKVGRAPDSDILLTEVGISRNHAMLEREDDFVWITDLHSRNGTNVNRERVASEERVPLRRLDRISFGNSLKEYVIEGNRSLDDTTCACTTEFVEPGTTPMESTAEGDLRNFGFAPGTIDFLGEGINVSIADELKRKYLPIRLLKSGGMGTIFLVQERFSGRFVALKVMLDQLCTSTPHVHQFVREAVITARLQHIHIIPVYDIGFIEGNQLYYTMRYVEGEPFARLLRSVSLKTRLAILQAAARAVDYAHVLGLWHRDLKPENILIHKGFDKNGEVFVIDWGLVSVQPGANYKLDLPDILIDRRSFTFEDRLIDETSEAITTMILDPAPGTGTARLIGTPAYMAPEQCRNDQQTMGTISDVWAFGVMLFEAITGEHPIPDHRELGSREIVSRVLHQDYRRPKSIDPSIPDPLDLLCTRMLKPPDERLVSLKLFIDELDSFIRQ